MKKTLLALILLITLVIDTKAQILDFNKMESIIPYLDNRQFEVPNYGYITFHFDKKKYKEIRDKVTSKANKDVPSDIPFDIEVKRYNAKKSENEYPSRVLPVINEEGNHWKLDVEIGDEKMASTGGGIWVSNKRQNAPEFFPTLYKLLADGDLYFEEKKFTKFNFEDYKKRFLSGYENHDTDNPTPKMIMMYAEPYTLSIVKCITINK
jgi:hypothetical protein